MEKSFYQQLKPFVMAHVKSYLTDFTTHDKKALSGYTGDFIFGYRTSGTNIFLLDNWFNALNEVLQTGKSEYFTPKGLREVISASLSFRETLDVMAIDPIFTGLQQEKFIIATNGKMKHVKTKTMLNKIDQLEEKSRNLQMQIRAKYYNPVVSYAY